jgi:4-amino-4-deoxy-L-arabinose transferase-like glycosyltransferase
LPGAKNMWEPVPQKEFFPQRTRLAITILRCYSMLLGLGTLLIIYSLAEWLFSTGNPTDKTGIAPAFAVALTAFNPMFLLISNSVNNDNLVIFFTSVGTYLPLRIKNSPSPIGTDIALGLILGLAVIAKPSGLILTPIVLMQIVLRNCSLRGKLQGVASFVLTATFTCGWWVTFNLFHYHEPFALHLHALVANNIRTKVDPIALLRPLEWSGFLKSYWGVFGAFDVIYPGEVYYLFFFITAGLFGCSCYFLIRHRRNLKSAYAWLVIIFGANFFALIWWTSKLSGSQGRLLFPSICSISILFTTGLFLLPQRLRSSVYIILAGTLLLVAAYGAWWVIPSSYL